MPKPILNTQDIQDLVIRRNFESLSQYFQKNGQLTDFRFFEINVTQTVTDGLWTHGLGYIPQDLIITQTTGTGTFTFNYSKFTGQQLAYTTTGPCKVRFFVGLQTKPQPQPSGATQSLNAAGGTPTPGPQGPAGAPGAAGTSIPSGVIVPFGGTASPTGYLLCDGAAVSRATYSTLFAAIGTAYGIGDGSTTFNVPDLRGMFIRGTDDMGSGAAGRDPDRASRGPTNGGNSGNNVGSVQLSAFASHSHGVNDPGHVHGVPNTNISISNMVGQTNNANSTARNSLSATTGISIQSNGGNETRPINVYCHYLIKT